jgi:hypothetical protein
MPVSSETKKPSAVRRNRLEPGRAVASSRLMTKPGPFRYFRTSHESFRPAGIFYVKFLFSLRHVKDLLHEYGNDIRHEPVRFWWSRFGGIVRLNSIAILFRGRRMVSIG